MNALNLVVVGEESEDIHFVTQNLFQNAYSLCILHVFLEYIADEIEKNLDKEAIFYLARLDDWIVSVVQCLQNEEPKLGIVESYTRTQLEQIGNSQ